MKLNSIKRFTPILPLLMLSAFYAPECRASRARDLVLGSGDGGLLINGGSLYYDTPYNIFYNPSYVNEYKNWAIIEKSNFPATTAQGGFGLELAQFSAAFFFNRGDTLTGSYSYRNSMRPLEFTVGADMGFKWGVGVSYGSFSSGGSTDKDFTLRGGTQIANFEPFVSFKIVGDERIIATATYRSFLIGTRYRWGEWVPYILYRKDTFGNVISTVAGVGLGRTTKLSDQVRLNYATGFFRTTATSRKLIPLDFSLEADAASWILVRAGLHYRAYDKIGDNSAGDSTTGRLGASLRFGNATFDWALGKVNSSGETAAALDSQNFDITSGLFTAASFAYRW